MKLKLNLTTQDRLDILTDAIETGAIAYWANDYGPITIERNQDLDITQAKFSANNAAGEKTDYIVNAETIQAGINRILEPGFEINPEIIDQIVAGDNDDQSCDCIIQAALFGQLVYG